MRPTINQKWSKEIQTERKQVDKKIESKIALEIYKQFLKCLVILRPAQGLIN